MRPAKITFYPEPAIFLNLKSAPPKKISERVNELLMKGLAKEQEEQIRAEYARYNQELAADPTIRAKSKGLSSTMIMSERLFDDEDSSDEDLF